MIVVFVYFKIHYSIIGVRDSKYRLLLKAKQDKVINESCFTYTWLQA